MRLGDDGLPIVTNEGFGEKDGGISGWLGQILQAEGRDPAQLIAEADGGYGLVSLPVRDVQEIDRVTIVPKPTAEEPAHAIICGAKKARRTEVRKLATWVIPVPA